MKISPANESDAATIVRLWELCGLTRPWNDPHGDFAMALRSPSASVLVARRADGRICGTVMVGFDGHRGWVYYLAVEPGQRRTGLGRSLMAAAEDWLRERGAPKIQLMVRDDNQAAPGFYAALGFDRQPVATFGKRLDR